MRNLTKGPKTQLTPCVIEIIEVLLFKSQVSFEILFLKIIRNIPYYEGFELK